ncbi:MAG: RIO1 family regulatory kinase/ATPase [Methanomassiliicoccales archaeon]
MAKEYGLSKVSVRPLGVGGSRLSIPVRITGFDSNGNLHKLFGKILGGADILTARTIQIAKNLYLEVNALDPLFGFPLDAASMAKHQFQTMKAIYELGIPTAKPYGYHQLNDAMYVVIYEYLDAKPVTEVGAMSLEQMDMVFGYLRKMHDNDLFHGDIKPDNVMVNDHLYILDVGHYLEEAPSSLKRSYDLACQIASFLQFQEARDIVKVARKHYSAEDLRLASEYLELIQKRPDINLSEDKKRELLRLMSD